MMTSMMRTLKNNPLPPIVYDSRSGPSYSQHVNPILQSRNLPHPLIHSIFPNQHQPSNMKIPRYEKEVSMVVAKKNEEKSQRVGKTIKVDERG